MKKLLFYIKLVLISFIIFIIQLAVWFCFELADYNQSEFGFYVFVTAFFLTFYLCFGLFQKGLGLRQFADLFLITSVQIGFSVFIIFSEETAKIRAIDILFYSVFIIIYYLVLTKSEKPKGYLIITILIFTLTCFFFYQKIAYYFLTRYFQENEFKTTTKRLDDFYYMNKDSSLITYPFKQKDKIYFVELWNRHCSTCIKNLPEMRRLMDYYKNDTDIKIISLYCPGLNSESRKWFYEEYCLKSKRIPKLEYHYTSVNTMDKYKITTFPHFFLIDKEGNGIEGSVINFNTSYPNSIYEKIEALKQK